MTPPYDDHALTPTEALGECGVTAHTADAIVHDLDLVGWEVRPQSPYRGDHRVVAGATMGAWGCAFIALFVYPLAALIIVLSWGMGLLTGLHTQAIREERYRR